MGKIIEFFSNLPRILEIALLKPQLWLATLLIVGTITYVSVSKSQKAQQRALVRKVKAVKAKQHAYNTEKDSTKLQKREKKYNKSLIKLRKRIRYALWWNKKKIVISNPYLLDTSNNANLAIHDYPNFTFKDILNEEVEKANKKRKHKTQIIEKNGVVKELAPAAEVVKNTKIAEPVKSYASTPVKEETKESTKNFDETYKKLETELKQAKPVQFQRSFKDSDNMSSIYKTRKNEEEELVK